MALAILELLDIDGAHVRFKIDTGTNRYYQLKIGRGVRRNHGLDWIEDVVFSTPLSRNEAGGGLLNSSKDVSLPTARFSDGNAYVQLFSFKNAEGKSPAFSRVVRVPVGFGLPAGSTSDFAPTFTEQMSMMTSPSFQPPRRIPGRTCREAYARQASVEDLLAAVVRVAAPVVVNLLGGSQNGARPNTPSGATVTNGNAGAQADALAQLLRTILNGVAGAPAGSTVSRQQSFAGSTGNANRFLASHAELSRPFITGIEIAGLVSAIGPLIGPALQGVGQITGPIAQAAPHLIRESNQALPSLINALNQANQHRVQLRQADNKLISDIVSEVNRRRLLEQLVEAQRQSPAGGQPVNAADLNTLIQLLQQQPTTTTTPQQPTSNGDAPHQPPAASTVTTQSLAPNGGLSSTLSSRAVVTFETAGTVAWNGTQKVLFTKNQALQLKLRLNVAEPAPKTPLPKAILKVVFKDNSEQTVLYEKTFKQKNVLPNSLMMLSFAQDELAHLPVNKSIAVLAEMRWLSTKTGREYKAAGSSEVVLVNRYFMKEQGNAVSPERELTDMKRFRPFWNKIWEAPLLDAASVRRDGSKKYLWELNVNAKYSVLLSAEQAANGLMETKILRGQVDEESLSEKTEGRMKAGIELSVSELNNLLPLWNGEAVLEREKLEAFQTDTFVQRNASELTYHFKLKGRAGERGMIWVVPVFRLFEFTLNSVSRTDEAGQVMALSEESVRFPLPVSARVIGLKSQR